MKCGCCGVIVLSAPAAESRMPSCDCLEEYLCRTCNHCEKHCRCAAGAQILDVPFPEQLAIAIHEWKDLGVQIKTGRIASM
jgi:hypothetical protein